MTDDLFIFLVLFVLSVAMGVGMFIYVNNKFDEMRQESEEDEGW